MNFSNIKSKLQDQLNSGADKYLSAKIKDELGLSKPTIESLHALSDNPGIEDDLNTFYKPVNSTFLSTKDYKNIQKWAITLIVLITIALVFLFFSMIIPQKDYSNAIKNSQIVVDGNALYEDQIEAKIEEEELDENEVNEELQVENISLETTSAEALAQSSPLLQSDAVTLVEYSIKRGDTLETIAMRFYGNAFPDSVDKIKVANKIRNVRLIQVGQNIIIPM